MAQENQFRTAGFGGFHRQDVLDYIERTAKEQAQKREELTRELEAARAAESESREKVEAVNLELEQLRAEAAGLRDRIAELEKPAEPKPDEAVCSAEELEQLRRDSESLREMKMGYAEIEMQAHQRANVQLAKAETQFRQILSEAEQKSRQMTELAAQEAERMLQEARDETMRMDEELRQRMERTQRDFSVSTDDLKSSVSGAMRQVEGLRQMLRDLNTTFEENAHSVENLCGEDEKKNG